MAAQLFAGKEMFLRLQALCVHIYPGDEAALYSCIYNNRQAGCSEQCPNHLQLPPTVSAVCLWLLRDWHRNTLHILRDDRRLTHCLFPDVYMDETYNPAYFKNNNDNNNNLKSKMLRALMLLHSQPKWLFCVVSHLLSKHALYPAHAHKRLQLLLSCSTTKPKFACCSLSCS